MPAFHVLELSPTATLLLNISLLTLIGFGLLQGERRLDDGRQLALLGMLSLFGIAGRVLLSPIPNVQPVTVIVLLAGMQMGARRAILLATVIALGSNLFLGHGIWTLYQAVGWSLVGCLGSVLGTRLESTSVLLVTAALSALMFDFVVSLSILQAVGPENLLAYLVAGIPYDLLHAVANMTFAAWLATPLCEMMRRHSISESGLEVGEVVSTPA